MKKSDIPNRAFDDTIPKKIDFNRIFHKVLWIIPLGVFANLLFTFLTTEKTSYSALTSFPLQCLLLALLLAIIPWFTNSLRVMIWTRFLKNKIKFKRIFLIILGAELGSAISPSAIGGGYVKLGMLIQNGFSAGTATSLTLLGSLEEFIFFLLSIPILFFLSLILDFPIDIHPLNQLRNRLSKMPVLLGILLAFILIGFLFRKFAFKNHSTGRLGKLVDSFKKLLHDFMGVYQLITKRGKMRFLLTLSLASIHWTARFSIIFAILAGFHIPFNPIQLFLYQWLVFALMMVTPTPGGAGGAEASFYLVYGAFIPESLLGLTTACWRLLTYYLQLSLATLLFSIFNLKWYRTIK